MIAPFYHWPESLLKLTKLTRSARLDNSLGGRHAPNGTFDLIFVAFWILAAPVGIDAYDNLLPTQQLAKARNDARAVAATFKDVGFQVILAEDTGRTAFLRSWQRFIDTVAPGDVTAL
jgi:Caspase domain